jgi:hypothetical protein
VIPVLISRAIKFAILFAIFGLILGSRNPDSESGMRIVVRRDDFAWCAWCRFLVLKKASVLSCLTLMSSIISRISSVPDP